MNNRILLPMLALFALNSQPTLARSIRLPMERATLTSLNIDPSLHYAGKVTDGEITVDHDRREATLVLYTNTCQSTDPSCPEIMPAPEVIQLPIIGISESDCGVRTITAEKDLRPVDGALNTLIIVDNSRFSCHDTPPQAPTEITHIEEHYSPMEKPARFRSTFTAQKLRRAMH